MVLVEGLQLNGKHITGSQIRKAWATISSKPLPKIKAITLSNADFNHIMDVRRCPEDDMREIEEWGRILSTKCTDACVFNADQTTEGAEYIILVRQSPYHSLEEILIHELMHIARGDL
jgi:hypothetical protein